MENLAPIFLLLFVLIGAAIFIPAAIYIFGRSSTASQPQRTASRQLRQSAAPRGSRGVTVHYRTRDGQADYSFSYEQQPGDTWRVFIQLQPNYGRRDDDAHTTHRLSDGGRKYICWTDPIRTLEQAKQVSAMWADATQNYIRTGTRF